MKTKESKVPETAAEISDLARQLCKDQKGSVRLIQIYRPFICPFEDILPHVPHGAEILDVGCCGGLFLGLAERTRALRRGIGFDADRWMISQAKILRLNSDVIQFHHLEVEMSWPDGLFDAISMIDVMHHIPPAAQAGVFPLVASRLRPGGLFIYKDINAEDRTRATANRFHDLVLAREWIHYLPASRARTLAEDAGLEEIFHRQINRLWYGHDLHIFRRTA